MPDAASPHPASPHPNDDRLTDLEVRMAFLERTLGELDGVVREVADELGRVRSTLADLKDHVVTADADSGSPRDMDLLAEKPPHY